MEKQRYPLSRLTSLGVGGTADRLAFPESEEEHSAELRRAADDGVAVRALGGGKNLLVDDRGVSGTVISLARIRPLTLSGTTITAGAGVPTGVDPEVRLRVTYIFRWPSLPSASKSGWKARLRTPDSLPDTRLPTELPRSRKRLGVGLASVGSKE